MVLRVLIPYVKFIRVKSFGFCLHLCYDVEKEVIAMPSEKEINERLFDQRTIVERLDRAHQKGEFEKERDTILSEIDRKLYQNPPKEN